MTTPTYDDATLAYDATDETYDGSCVATITYDEAGLSWDALDITYDGCDHRGATPTPTVTAQVGSGLLGRRGPYIDEQARKVRLLRDDDEVLVLT